MSTANLYRPVSKLFNGFDNQGCLASCYETLQNNINQSQSSFMNLIHGCFALYCATSAKTYKN